MTYHPDCLPLCHYGTCRPSYSDPCGCGGCCNCLGGCMALETGPLGDEDFTRVNEALRGIE